MNQIQATANKCWYITATKLVERLLSGSISQATVQEVLDSTPELETILPAETTQREQIARSVFQAVQLRKQALDQIPDFIGQLVPQHDDTELRGHAAAEFMGQIRQQLEDSLFPVIEILIHGDIDTYKDHMARESGDDSLRNELPLERFSEKIIAITSREEGKADKLQFLERFRSILAEDLPEEKESLILHLQEVIWNLNNFSAKIFTPQDKLDIIRVLEEEIKVTPQLGGLYEQLNGDIDQLIGTIFSAQAASALLNKELRQNTRPEDFYAK